MIKPAVLSEELFIVLLPDGEVLEVAQEVQRRISEHFDLYEEGFYPQIHITLDRIKKDNIEDALPIIRQVVEQSEPVEITIDKFECFDCFDNKVLVLDVLTNKSLDRFATRLHQKLMEEGLSTIDNYEQWNYHISLINNVFAKNPLSEKEFDQLCLTFDGLSSKCKSSAIAVEIWRPTLDPSRKCVESLELSNKKT